MSNILHSRLPDFQTPTTSDPQYIETLLKKELPRQEAFSLGKYQQWRFLLDKFPKRKKVKAAPARLISRRQRKELELLKLPKDNWNYNELEPLRQYWRQYMMKNLNLFGNRKISDQEFGMVLVRSEFVGAQVKVVRSKVPSLVGLNGTLILDTKMTFQIVTPQNQLKIVVKDTSVFEFSLDNMRLTIFGKHLMTRPSDRSVKKIKAQTLPDL